MKTPTNIGGHDLAAWLLTATEMIVANLFTITLKNGQILRYTDWDLLVTIGGTTWQPGPPNLALGQIEEAIGTVVSTTNFTIGANPTDLIYSTPILQTVSRGDWDGAVVLIQRLYMAIDQTQIGYITRWLGTLGDITKINRLAATLKAKAMIERLSTKLPIKILQPGCVHLLFDAGCGLNPASFRASSSAQSGSTVNLVKCGLTNATDYWDLGVLSWTSGPNNGFGYTVKLFTNGSPSTITFQRPLLYAPGVGDTFTIVPGCDKTQDTCTNKFSNLANFLGFPYVPAPETALAWAIAFLLLAHHAMGLLS